MRNTILIINILMCTISCGCFRATRCVSSIGEYTEEIDGKKVKKHNNKAAFAVPLYFLSIPFDIITGPIQFLIGHKEISNSCN